MVHTMILDIIPILTTKKIFIRGVVEELLWFVLLKPGSHQNNYGRNSVFLP